MERVGSEVLLQFQEDMKWLVDNLHENELHEFLASMACRSLWQQFAKSILDCKSPESNVVVVEDLNLEERNLEERNLEERKDVQKEETLVNSSGEMVSLYLNEQLQLYAWDPLMTTYLQHPKQFLDYLPNESIQKEKSLSLLESVLLGKSSHAVITCMLPSQQVDLEIPLLLEFKPLYGISSIQSQTKENCIVGLVGKGIFHESASIPSGCDSTPNQHETLNTMDDSKRIKHIDENSSRDPSFSVGTLPIMTMDPSCCITSWNNSLETITGIPLSDVVGKHLASELVSKWQSNEVASKLNSIVSTKESQMEMDLFLLSSENVPVFVQMDFIPQFNVHHDVIGILATGHCGTSSDAEVHRQEYYKLLQRSNIPMFGTNLKGEINLWNHKMEELLDNNGCPIEEKCEFLHFVEPSCRSKFSEWMDLVLSKKEAPNEIQMKMLHSRGGTVCVLLSIQAKYDLEENITGIIGTIRDISERVTQQNEYYRLIEEANAPVLGLDVEGRVDIWNIKLSMISGYSLDEMKGKDFIGTMLHPETAVGVSNQLHKVLAKETNTSNFLMSFTSKTGQNVEALMSFTVRLDMYGKVIGVVGIGQDMTEKKTHEQEYRRLIDEANVPIISLDRRGRISSWNPSMANALAILAEDALGKDLVSTFIEVQHRQAVKKVIYPMLHGVGVPHPEYIDLFMVSSKGTVVDISACVIARLDASGKVKGLVMIGENITARKIQELEFQRFINHANIPILGVDRDGKINLWNMQSGNVFGYSGDKAIGMSLVGEMIVPESRAYVLKLLGRVLANDQSTTEISVRMITENKRQADIMLNLTPRLDLSGHIVGAIGIANDFTDRREQEDQYRLLIDNANIPLIGVNKSGQVDMWNRKASFTLGYVPDEIMGSLFLDMIVEEHRELVREMLDSVFAGEIIDSSKKMVFVAESKQKVPVYLSMNFTPRTKADAFIGALIIAEDVTEKRIQHQEYFKLIDQANAPIVGADVNTKITIWNQKAAAITGYQFSELENKKLIDFVVPAYREAVQNIFTMAVNGKETPDEFDFPLITKNGTEATILMNVTQRMDAYGRLIGVVGIGQDVTEKRSQEQEYIRLITYANAPIFGVDVNGMVNIWNQKAAEITGFSADEAIGKKLTENFVDPDYQDYVETMFMSSLQTRHIPEDFEFPLVNVNGARVEIILNLTTRLNRTGNVVGAVGIGQDVTERNAKEVQYQQLIDSANAPIFGVDVDCRVNIWNKKAAGITRYSTPEVLGEDLVETFISPEYRPIVSHVLHQALNGIETANFEFPLVTRPGNRVDILLNATPRRDHFGKIVGVVGIGQDITERIAQEHEYFRLIDTANAPIFGVDSNGCINEWNQKIEKITGYHKQSILGLDLIDEFVIPENKQQVREAINQALMGLDVGEMELAMETKSGELLVLLVNASSKKDMHGNIRGVIGVGQDYTARKRMEQAKVNFLASFSHELRTPLNGILGMLELLKEQSMDNMSERYVHMAYVSGSLLLNLINDILDLSKIEAGHLEISCSPFVIKDVLQYSIEIFKFKAKERGLKLSLHLDRNIPSVVSGDVVRLRQVLLNLLTNAIKFTHEGSISVSCKQIFSAHPESSSTYCRLLFEVVDTGVGMDRQEQSHLFSLFTKLERTRKQNPTGSGLGLAICKQLVELMGGEIGVRSELGAGSTFFFTIVCMISKMDILHLELSPRTISRGLNLANTEDISIPSRARVLVVEDNEFNWEVVKHFLREDDHLLQWVCNGLEAVREYKKSPLVYDLVFMDCEMPIMDGYTATRNIRAIELEMQLPRIPVVGVTAYAMSGDRQKCLDAGMDEFIVKPCSKGDLQKALAHWLVVRHATCLCHSTGATSPSVISKPNLAPASSHLQQLNLTKAMSDLQLENPLMFAAKSINAPESLDRKLRDMEEVENNSEDTVLVGDINASFPVLEVSDPLHTQINNSMKSESPERKLSFSSNSTTDIHFLTTIPDGDPINFSLGCEMCGGDEEAFSSFVEKFVPRCRSLMEKITTLSRNDDLDGLRKEAHSLKGAAAYAAANRLSKAAFRVELLAKKVMVDASVSNDLKDSLRLLQSEYSLLGGYLARNFDFSKSDTSRHSKDRCLVM